MPGGVRTLTVTPGAEIQRDAITFTSVQDYDNTGIFHVFSRASRPTYRFKMTLPGLVKLEADSLAGFHHFHMGGRAFFWDGGNFGEVSSLALVGEGDGTRTEFFLPNRFVDANSISMAIFDGTATSITTAFSLNPDPGIIAFDTAPDSGDDVLGSHGHKYKVVFEGEGLKMVNFSRGVWRAELLLRETIL